MKKILTLLLACALILSLAACGQKAPTWQEQYDLGIRYLTDGNYEEAIIAFTAAIEIDPKKAEAYIGRGDAYIGSGETDENLTAAMADYEKAVEADETNAAAYLGLADVYIRMGEYDKAMEILKTGLEKSGNDPSIADKIAEMEQGSFVDSSNRVRRNNDYNMDNQLTSYTLYEYDTLGRRCGWENWSYEDHDSDNGYMLLDTPYLDNYCIVTFNSQNLPEKNQFYKADGVPDSYDTFVYNEKGLKTEQYRYKPEGELDCYFLYYYNDLGQRIKYEGYHADGSMYGYWISEYDANGNFVKETHYDQDGKASGYSING